MAPLWLLVIGYLINENKRFRSRSQEGTFHLQLAILGEGQGRW